MQNKKKIKRLKASLQMSNKVQNQSRDKLPKNNPVIKISLLSMDYYSMEEASWSSRVVQIQSLTP
jgi:hypothetical protein